MLYLEDRDWYIIKYLYKEKNITKAAQSLYMSQPALTARLKHIEREFSVKIVNRSTKGVQFTTEGEFLATKASTIIEQLQQLKNEVQNIAQLDGGTIEIGASNYFTMYTLPMLLEAFKLQYPHANFKVTTDWSKNIFGLIYKQKIHIGFVSVDYGGCKGISLLYEEPICIACNQPFTFNDLPQMPRIDYQSDYLLKSQLDKWWRENFALPPTISMQVDKLATCKEMICHGLGYGFLPTRIIKDIPYLHKINILTDTGQPLTRKTWMLNNNSSPTLPIVSAFREFVKQQQF